MKIIFDHKIFWNQKFGGISRYFVNLIKKLNEEENIDYKVISPFYKNNYLNEIDKKKVFGIFISNLLPNLFHCNDQVSGRKQSASKGITCLSIAMGRWGGDVV